MKKLRFFLVSAVLAGVSFVANATERVVNVISDNEQKIEKLSQQQLVLLIFPIKTVFWGTALTAPTVLIAPTVLTVLTALTILASRY